MATLSDLIAEEVVWHLPGRSPLADDYDGRDATFGYFSQLAALSDGTVRANLESIVAEGDTVVARQTNTATRGTRQLNDKACLVFEMRNGHVVEVREYHYDQYAMDEFWS